MKLSKTDYRGSAALTLQTRAFSVTASTGFGPRLVDFRSRRGDAGNLFLQMPPDEKREHGYLFRGGHRLWHAPEDLERTYEPDDAPVTVKTLTSGVQLTQPVEPKSGMQKAIKLETRGEGTLAVTHTLTNRGPWPVETAPWALTMFRPGGYAVLPLLPKGSHAGGDLLPTYSLVPWSYTDLSAPVWRLHRDFIGIDVAAATEPHKLGITRYPGWSAYWLEGTLFVKHARVRNDAVYPDSGCCFETFTNGQMVELETLAPLSVMQPRQSVSHVEHWTVLDGLKRPDWDEAFAALAKRVQAWLKTL